MLKKILAVGGVVTIAALPLLAAAQTFAPVNTANPIQSLFDLLKKIANYFLTAVIVIAAIMIIYAGFKYVTAAGDEEAIKTAKNVIIYAVVGVGIGLLAQLIVAVAGAIVGGKAQ